jgi:hypothetical protein
MTLPLERRPIETTEMRPAPIDPAQIVDGTPVARVGSLATSRDKVTWTDLWDCTGGTFRWTYRFDETVHVIEGAAVITDADGVVHTVGPGDVVTFRQGTSAHWHVPEYVRKVAFCRRPMPRWMAFVVRARARALTAVTRATLVLPPAALEYVEIGL